MNPSEFRELTPSVTLIWMDARIKDRKRMDDSRSEELLIGRLNTYYIMKNLGSDISAPEKLYRLQGDVGDRAPAKRADLFTPEMNELFDKF